MSSPAALPFTPDNNGLITIIIIITAINVHLLGRDLLANGIMVFL